MTVDIVSQLDNFKLVRPDCEKIDIRFMCKTNPNTARLLCFGHEVSLTIPSEEGDSFYVESNASWTNDLNDYIFSADKPRTLVEILDKLCSLAGLTAHRGTRMSKITYSDTWLNFLKSANAAADILGHQVTFQPSQMWVALHLDPKNYSIDFPETGILPGIPISITLSFGQVERGDRPTPSISCSQEGKNKHFTNKFIIHKAVEEFVKAFHKAQFSTNRDFGDNLFLDLFFYVDDWLDNAASYCAMCYKRHGCMSDTKLMVCHEPLCMFQYADLWPELKHDVTVCGFKGCSTPLGKSAEMGGKTSFKTSLANYQDMCKKFGHKYLLTDQIMKGLTPQVVAAAKSIKNILRIDMAVRFELKMEEFARNKVDATPHLVFHGTPLKNLKSIMERGLLVPGKEGNGVGHTTDSGYWGRGIYTSPSSDLSFGYCRGQGGVMLICAILMGDCHQTTVRLDGQARKSGCNSHKDPSGQEWIVFDESQVLPCFLIEF